jgi:bacterioferritin
MAEQKQAKQGPSVSITMLQGAITEAYQCDPVQMVAKLNALRATELAAELQYRHHAYMAVSLSAPGVKAEFLEHAAQEAHHADLLAVRIQQLGGDPIFDPHDIAQVVEQLKLELGDPQTLEEMIAYNLKVERRQIVLYTNMVREVAFKDPGTRRILEDILIDSEHHAAELADLINKKAH